LGLDFQSEGEIAMLNYGKIQEALGKESEHLLGFKNPKVAKEKLHLPSPTFVSDIFGNSDRSPQTLRSLQAMYGQGRLANTGYLSILPVDQGIEHSAGASFAKNPIYFDPENILKLAIEGGCNAVATTFGSIGMVARKYAHKIPMMVKINHNELLTYPNKADQVMFGSIKQAWDMGCVAVGATIYFGSDQSTRQIQEVSKAFEMAHSLGMATVLWCYTRNDGFKVGGKDYHTSADLTKLDERMYTELSSDHPIDLTRYQLINSYMGRVGLINSGGASGANDMEEALATAVINKRAGGMGLISGRKAFQKPMADGVALLNAIQDVYLCKEVTIA
jgi:class I fructose-bisphosphate aldolase